MPISGKVSRNTSNNPRFQGYQVFGQNYSRNIEDLNKQVVDFVKYNGFAIIPHFQQEDFKEGAQHLVQDLRLKSTTSKNISRLMKPTWQIINGDRAHMVVYQFEDPYVQEKINSSSRLELNSQMIGSDLGIIFRFEGDTWQQ